ncbi:MAG: aldose 1-epimerase family protein, partial [Eubacteriales bacterium]|nr:aldose 1-epimerase family protein [Eubacteriales bacterium]
YQLTGRTVKVMWKVQNPAEETLYFSIGAHPAFLCPIREGEVQSDCAFLLKDKEGHTVKEFVNTIFGSGGLVTARKECRETEDGVLMLDEHLFDNDALVLEDDQIGEVAILDGEGKPYLTVQFDAPVVGLWSPPKKKAPFVCIEPWYGRCDEEGFTGDLTERKWTNRLEAGEWFEASYSITI